MADNKGLLLLLSEMKFMKQISFEYNFQHFTKILFQGCKFILKTNGGLGI